MTHVPLPLALLLEGPEVGVSRVDGSCRELEQPPGSVPPMGIIPLDLVGFVGHTILLHGALHQQHGPVLQVGRLLDLQVVHHQIRRPEVADHSRHMLPVAVAADHSLPHIVMQAVGQFGFVAETLAATENGPGDVGATEEVRLEGLAGVAKSQLPADHVGLQEGPAVGTDTAPPTSVQADLHPTLVPGPTAPQSDVQPGTGVDAVLGQVLVPQDRYWQGDQSVLRRIAYHAGRLAGLAVVLAPALEVAGHQFLLVTLAEEVVHPEATTGGPKVATPGKAPQAGEAQLPADNVTFGGVPFIIANGAPFAIVQDLDVSWPKGT